MFIQLQILKHLVGPGVEINKTEVIRRYRLQPNCNRELLNLLCMTAFFKMYRNHNGDIEIV